VCADIVLIDLKKKVKVNWDMLHSRCDWNIYDGWEFTGWPVMTLVRGNIVMEWPDDAGRAKVTDAFQGQYVRRQLTGTS